MVCNWEPGVSYNLGDVVTYDGCSYRIIQPHRSQGDWTPPVTPALWGRIPGGNQECAPCPPPQQSQQPQQPWQQPQQAPAANQPAPPPPAYSNDDKHSQNQGHEPKPQKDSDSDGEGSNIKKIFGIGGGIAAGAALLGAGFAAYKHHEHSKERAEKESEWLREAELRTEKFEREGPTGPITWVLTRGKRIPEAAIEAGRERDWSLYVARAFHKGSLTPGKASGVFEKGAVIGYAHDEIPKDTYEILIGRKDGVRWVPTSGKLKLSSLGSRAVEGGFDTDGSALFIARANHKGSLHPGKASERLKGAFIPYGGSEVEVSEYEVLCYA